MKIETLTNSQGSQLIGPMLITPDLFKDDRGFFFESWNQLRWNESMGLSGQVVKPFVQDNHSLSSKGVLRGLHYQLPPHPQGKLVRCIAGEIFDVAVDIRRNSLSFGQWCGVILNSENHQQLWVPEGFAHGFLTLSNVAEVLYKTTDFWNHSCERSIRWDDPHLQIEWPESDLEIKVSSKDGSAPFMNDLNVKELI